MNEKLKIARHAYYQKKYQTDIQSTYTLVIGDTLTKVQQRVDL